MASLLLNKIRVRLQFDMPPPLPFPPCSDKFMFLINKDEMQCVADVEHSIATKFGFSNQSLILSIDKFSLSSSDNIDIFHKDDVVCVSVGETIYNTDFLSFSEHTNDCNKPNLVGNSNIKCCASVSTKQDVHQVTKLHKKSKKNRKLKSKKKNHKSQKLYLKRDPVDTKRENVKSVQKRKKCDKVVQPANRAKVPRIFGITFNQITSSLSSETEPMDEVVIPQNVTATVHKQSGADVCPMTKETGLVSESTSMQSLNISSASLECDCADKKIHQSDFSMVNCSAAVDNKVMQFNSLSVKKEMMEEINMFPSSERKNGGLYPNLPYSCEDDDNNLLCKEIKTEALVEKKAEGPSVQNYEALSPVSWPPRIGDFIAFKQLEMSADYCPEISSYKEARVLNVISDSGTGRSLDVHVVWPSPVASTKSAGKFEIIYDSDEEPPQKSKCFFTVSWNSMVEPRLIR